MHNPDLGLTRLCRLFGKTRQAYYDQSWRNSDEQLHEAFIIDKVKTIRQHIQLHGMLREELRLHNIQIGRDRFYDLLRKHNLLIKSENAMLSLPIPITLIIMAGSYR
jgi:putative transposase